MQEINLFVKTQKICFLQNMSSYNDESAIQVMHVLINIIIPVHRHQLLINNLDIATSLTKHQIFVSLISKL